MNADEFEAQLQRRTLPALPESWREEILAAAQQGQAQDETPRKQTKSEPMAGWFTLLFGWRGLAAAWAVIAVVHVANLQTERPPSAPIGSALAWKERRLQEQQLTAELGDPVTSDPAAAPPSVLPSRKSSQRLPARMPVVV